MSAFPPAIKRDGCGQRLRRVTLKPWGCLRPFYISCTRMQTETFMEFISQLSHKRSPKRRAAAKALRKLGDMTACPYLLEALREEVKDPRTWETQYQMIMALGECACDGALSYLKSMALSHFDATMVYVAIGDSLVRLQPDSDAKTRAIKEMMQSGNTMLVDGAFRAMAMLRLTPDDETVSEIVAYVSTENRDDSLRTWVAAAAAGWNPDLVAPLLKECASSSDQQLARAANSSLKRKYVKWSPL